MVSGKWKLGSGERGMGGEMREVGSERYKKWDTDKKEKKMRKVGSEKWEKWEIGEE